jgi:hypothetical protein
MLDLAWYWYMYFDDKRRLDLAGYWYMYFNEKWRS